MAILCLSRPSLSYIWVKLFGIFFSSILIAGVLMFVVLKATRTQPPLYFIGILIVIIFILYAFYWFLLLRTYDYEVNSENVIFRGGLIERTTKNVPYNKITNIELTQNLLERPLGLWKLHVQTASTGNLKAEIVYVGLTDPEHFKELILKRIK